MLGADEPSTRALPIDDPHGEQRTQTVSMDLQKHNWITGDNEKSQWVLDHLRHNNPALKELIIVISDSTFQEILLAFDAITTSSSTKILNIEGTIDVYLIHDANSNNLVMTKLSRNMSIKDISIDTADSWLTNTLADIVMASPNLEALTT